MGSPKTRDKNPVQPSGESATRLKDIYNGYFQIVLAETEEQRKSGFRLRYEVYCVEHPYFDQNPNGMETDGYDSTSLHALLIHRPSSNVVGTVRLILPRPNGGSIGLPIDNVCHHEFIARDTPDLPWAHTAEVSRFAISKTLRRRASDRNKDEMTSVGSFSIGNDRKRIIPNASLGLMQAIVAMAAKGGVTHLCCVMEPTLLRMLSKLGIHFDPLGPPVEYHGRRQPCYSFLDALLARIWLERPDVWELVTRDGSLWPLNTDLVETLRLGAVRSLHQRAESAV